MDRLGGWLPSLGETQLGERWSYKRHEPTRSQSSLPLTNAGFTKPYQRLAATKLGGMRLPKHSNMAGFTGIECEPWRTRPATYTKSDEARGGGC